ncbi:MAG TPA: PilZ domain-containing protein [Vicinamibacterales bacterium]|nr:PilZ domain-containing protein [Vicinamibacterales bacterium]
MDQQVIDRRMETRFPLPSQTVARVTLRPGCSVDLVDMSAGGVLVEAQRPLRPGARVHLQVATPDRTFSIAAHVTRCVVWSLDPLDGVRYRGALRFEHRIEWNWQEPARLGSALPESAGPTERSIGHLLPAGSMRPGGLRRRRV